jgi:hypothetical protein
MNDTPKPKIGIGYTTYKRDALLQECLDNLRLYTTSDYKLHIARDSDEDRRGIALRKNECLHHLQDCDYIFLFDDDCYPKKKGWEQFTDAIISKVNEQNEGVVYLLWGSKAQQKLHFVNQTKNLVLEAVHPSPLSAYRGFFGCKHFSRTNEYLISVGKDPIHW